MIEFERRAWERNQISAEHESLKNEEKRKVKPGRVSSIFPSLRDYSFSNAINEWLNLAA